MQVGPDVLSQVWVLLAMIPSPEACPLLPLSFFSGYLEVLVGSANSNDNVIGPRLATQPKHSLLAICTHAKAACPTAKLWLVYVDRSTSSSHFPCDIFCLSLKQLGHACIYLELIRAAAATSAVKPHAMQHVPKGH